MNLLKRNEKSYSFWFLFLTSIFFLLLRIPSLFEPYWYGDEGVYQAVAILINSGADLYSGAWENKPPLLLIIYALLNSDQFLIRSLSLIFGIVSIWFFFFISKKLFIRSKYAPFVSTLFYSLVFGTRIIEGNIANAENFMILPILIGAFLVLSGENLKKSRQALTYFSAGLLLSFAFLIKIVAVFDFLAFGFYLFINSLKDFKKDLTYKILPFILGFLSPILITVTYFFFTDHFKQFTEAFLFCNISYFVLNNNFIFPQSFFFLKVFLLFIILLSIFLYRNKIDKKILFISVWFAFSIFDAFFSQRPYTHYLIMLLPAFSLMVGSVIEFKKERLALITYLLITFIVVSLVFDFKGKIVDYYKNFILYTTCLLYTSPSPRDRTRSRMPSSA